MKKKIFSVFLILLFSFSLFAIDGKTVLSEVEKRIYGDLAPKDIVSDMVMKIHKKDSTKIRELRTWAKNNPRGDDPRLMKFLAPKDIKNTGFLSLSEEKMYVYLPEFHRIRRIASSNKKDSFFGSDFSYDDMGATEFSKFYIPELKSEDDTYFMLVLRRKNGMKKPYSKIELKVLKSNYMPTLMKLYDNSGNLWKVAEQKPQKIKNYWLITYIKMKDVKKGTFTEVELKNIKVDSNLKKSIFTKRFLKKKVR